MLSSSFHLHDLHAVLNLVPVLTQKSQGMQVVRTRGENDSKQSDEFQATLSAALPQKQVR